MKKAIFSVLLTVTAFWSWSQETSVAREWNEVLLEAIRNDFARPTVHARNLFHVSAAMYDTWAAYDEVAVPYLFNRSIRGYLDEVDFSGFPSLSTTEAKNEAISYVAYRLIKHRFSFSPGTQNTFNNINELMEDLGYDVSVTSTDLSSLEPAALGNYIAQSYIDYGLLDGSNEDQDYINLFYKPVNPPLVPIDPGNPLIIDLNRWQPLFFDEFIDQAGNSIPSGVVDFLSPEWGQVIPFAMNGSERTIYEREGNEYWVYHDPGPPPYLTDQNEADSELFKWGFSMVSIWGAHLGDESLVDISPGNFGNTGQLPTSFEDYDNFYNYLEGGDIGEGHELNPHTGLPYESNLVKLSDYSRVLAEFWADGPDSETPPGHWFTILNYVMDHELFERKFEGTGEELPLLEFDVKAYFLLGGTMHDAAISAWGVKGWYDYIRPISAIRAMADLGQSTDQNAANYNSLGIPLVDGFIETVKEGDDLAGPSNENVGKIKLFTWQGPDFIDDPETDIADVGWILAENWWPYQRPTFVTPPFAGYVSGHSTYSRAAAEVLTLLTGDPFFPGGVGEFVAEKNEFLVFEDGPSEDVVLQWATYRDASDQTSLSRIWGGIHPPADDIPGRIMGIEIGVDAFNYAKNFFLGEIPLSITDENSTLVYPNPLNSISQKINIKTDSKGSFEIFDLRGNSLLEKEVRSGENSFDIKNINAGLYLYRVSGSNERIGRLLIKN